MSQLSYSLFSHLSYGLPTKTTEMVVMQEQGTKMYLDAILKTHERVVQVTFIIMFQTSLKYL